MEEESSSYHDRSHMYKTNGRKPEHLRKKRRDDQVHIRKVKRDEQIERSRRITVENEMSDLEMTEVVKGVVEGLQSMNADISHAAAMKVLEYVTDTVWTTPFLAKIEIINKLAEIYCNRSPTPVTCKLIAHLFGKIAELDELKLADLTHSDQTKSSQAQSDQICIESIVSIISTHQKNETVVCDALQALSCFLVVGVTYRNLALDYALVPELLALAAANLSEHMNRSIMYIVSVFCDKLDQYSPHVEEILPLLEIVASGVRSQDTMIQNDAANCCVFLSDWEPINPYMKEYELCQMLVVHLFNDTGVLRPTHKWAINTIIQTTAYFTQDMIDAGLLEKLRGFVNVSYLSPDICFLIANICAEGSHNVDQIIASGIMKEVFRVMESAEYRSRKEAAYVVCQCCASKEPSHLNFMIDSGMLGSFIDLLTCMDANLVFMILEALDCLLHYGQNFLLSQDSTNPVAEKLDELGCLRKLEFLTESQLMNIHVKAFSIIDSYYNNEEHNEWQLEEFTKNNFIADHRVSL